MLNINNMAFTGRLTRDPEMKYTQANLAICTLAVAINNPKKVGGEWKSETVFIDVTCFDKTAERAAELVKGDAVYVEGKLKQDNWESKDGQKRSKILCGAMSIKPIKDPETGGSGRSSRVNAETYRQESGGPSEGLDFSKGADDDINF